MQNISIHAPSRERLVDIQGRELVRLFQSTLPRGSDAKVGQYISNLVISIHAPSRERQRISCVNVNLTANFNPRSLAGATISLRVIWQNCLYFNPRSLAGATFWFFVPERLLFISIHAPSRERRASALSANYNIGISIHAPSRERRDFMKLYCIYDNFNPRSLAGATASTRRSFSAVLISIHAPSRERLQHRKKFLFR